MKLKFSFIALLAILCWVINNSNTAGAGAANFNCNNCHSGSNTTTTIDSLVLREVSTNEKAIRYSPSTNYIVTLYGQNSGSLTKFGFQATHNGKGTFSSPSGDCQVSGNIWEHKQKIIGTGNKYQVSARWTSPATGSGLVTFNAYLNAVNDNGGDSGDKPSSLFTYSIDELTPGDSAKVEIRLIAGVNEPKNTNPLTFKAYPTNGGATPEYQWRVNSTNIGGRTTEDTYIASKLKSGDSIYCWMYSSKSGALPVPALSNVLFSRITIGNSSIHSTEDTKEIYIYKTEKGLLRFIASLPFKARLSLYQISGKRVQTYAVNENSTLDCQDLPKGYYIAQMEINGRVWSQKISLD